MGDKCLPAADLRRVVGFARTNGALDIGFYLVTLDNKNNIQVMAADHLKSGNSYKTLSNKSKDEGGNIKMKHIAYYNDGLTAYDEESYTWNVKVDFIDQFFSAEGRAKVDPITDLTSNNMGPVALRSDE